MLDPLIRCPWIAQRRLPACQRLSMAPQNCMYGCGTLCSKSAAGPRCSYSKSDGMRVSGRGLSGVYKNLAGAMGGNKACCLCVRARGWEGFGEHACSHCKDRARTLSLARPFPEWSDTQYQEHQASAPELSVVSGVMASARMGEDGPTIVVKVLKADKVRTNARGDAPDPMVKLRINVGRCPPFLP